jgi:hypothetical protein
MYEPQSFKQSILKVVNLTTDLDCGEFLESQEDELNMCLRLWQKNYPNCEFAVYKIIQIREEIRVK